MTVIMSTLFLLGSVLGVTLFATAKNSAGSRCIMDPDPNPTYTSASARVEFSFIPFGWTCFWQEDDRAQEQRSLPFWP